MSELRISEDMNGLWTVYAPGLVVTDLSRDAAEAFAEAYRRIQAV